MTYCKLHIYVVLICKDPSYVEPYPTFAPTLSRSHSTRRQRKKDYLGNIFFGTATDVDGAGGLMQLEQVGATEE